MRRFLLAALLLATPAFAQADHPLLHEIANAVKADSLRAIDTRLVSFGTRHTLSDTTSKTRGIGAARAWVKGEFEKYARACSCCLAIDTPVEKFTGTRAPNGVDIMDVLAIQKGTTDPNRVIIIAGHIDSRVTGVMNATADAPGANDDGSGTSAVIEAARVLSQHKFPATIVYAVLQGEEQGLFGGTLLAHYARAHNWQVEADLNNDIIGNTHAQNGTMDNSHVRVFSEGTKSLETAAEAERRRYNGGELDSPSRNLARFMAPLADKYLQGFSVNMIYRTDRFGRGGDQVPMLGAGYPAVRITEVSENYTRQHQDLRTENGIVYGDTLAGVDFDYLAQVTRLNAVSLAALAMAPAPPSGVTTAGALGWDTTVKWTAVPGAVNYKVWWRDTLAPQWQQSKDAGNATTLTLKDVNIDNWFFGVSAVSADGYESPVVFPGAAGAF
jgi:Zn-dependent M28 family amino/carboxypeptidase